MKVTTIFFLSFVCCIANATTISSSTSSLEQFIVQENEDGIVVNVQNNHTVELAVEGKSAFRISISYDTSVQAGKIDTVMVAEHTENAPFQKVSDGKYTGIKTSFGSIEIDPTTNHFQMLDSSGKKITWTDDLSEYTSPSEKQQQRTLRGITSIQKSQDNHKIDNTDLCHSPLPNSDVSSGDRVPDFPDGLYVNDQKSCCETCNNNTNCNTWIFASKGHESPDGKNCWLMENVHSTHNAQYRTVGGKITPPPPPQNTLSINLGSSLSASLYGSGSGGNDANTLTRTNSNPSVSNTQFYVPHYYSTDGYSALGVTLENFNENDYSQYPASWDYYNNNLVQWSITGAVANLYLIPSNDMGDGISKYWDLIGRPAIPPRYAFGFLACRWGWKDSNTVLNTLKEFRSGNYPIDAWISDFEWYTPEPDYNLPDQGSPSFKDFDYNSVIFPQPTDQLKTYHSELNLRFGGIRKPRLGNSALLTMAKSKGWLVDPKAGTGSAYNARDLNYSIPEVREWYASQMSHFLSDGVDFWWNDEGESSYFNFYHWNEAEQTMLAKFDKKKRFWTINRSYSPGMQRQGSLTWTGDVPVTWDALVATPGYVLNWELAGTAYITCDTGGFNGGDVSALLLSRWYQVSAFIPIMRVHSKLGNTAHFPFNYPSDAQDSMRKSMNLRYQLIPYHYSLAHHMYDSTILESGVGKPMMRPLLMEFPTDAAVSELTSQWMDGDHLMVAPVTSQDNASRVYFPEGTWYVFNGVADAAGNYVYSGSNTQYYNNVPLDTIPTFVLAGGVIPLAPVVQYSDALPGGALEVQVYSGADGSFVFVEDDGETLDYESGSTSTIKTTTYEWSDKSKTLSWKVGGSFKGDAHTFTQVYVTMFEVVDGKNVKQTKSGVKTIGTSGTISF